LTIGVNLRTLSAAAATLALAIVPAAEAKQAKHQLPADTHVCNSASQNWQGGDLEASPLDPQGPHRFPDKFRKHNNTNANAAMHSQALVLCGEGEDEDGSTGGDGGSTGGDGGSTGGDGGSTGGDGGSTGGDGGPVDPGPGYGV
jgi:hypothetical protein